MKILKLFDNYTHKLFSLDVRSLALARIILAIVYFDDMLARVPIIDDFYSDLGVISRGEFLQHFAVNPKFSLLLLNGTTLYVQVFFLLAFLLGFLFLIGFKTRIASFCIFIIYLSLHHRMPLILSGADILVRLCFFYFSFLPINAKFSMDAALVKASNSYQKTKQTNIFSAWSAVIFIQLILIYLFTFLFKWHPDWHTHFTAVHYALHLQAYARPWSRFLIDYPFLTKPFTFFAIVAEGLVALFLIIPFKFLFFRYAIIFALIGLHFGIFTTFNLFHFSWTCIALWISILPSHFWDTLKKKINIEEKIKNKYITIFYDDDCTFCLKMVYLVLEFLIIDEDAIKIQKASSNPKANQLLKENHSWVVKSNDEYSIRYEAFLVLFKTSFFSKLSKLFDNPISKFIGNNLYLIISHNRKIFNLPLKKFRQSEINLSTSKLSNLFGLLVLGIIIAWNIKGIGYYKNFKISQPFRDIGIGLQIFQKWDMFSPTPFKDNGYYIFEGIRQDKSTWDVFYDEPINYDWLPKDIYGRFSNVFWRKFFINIWSLKNKKYRPYFAKWLCRRWNSQHKGHAKIEKVQGFYMLNKTAPFGKKRNKTYKKTRIFRQDCR